MFYTTYHYVPRTITHAPRFPRKITIHVHHVPRQITMLPAFFQNKPQVFPTCFHEFTRNIDCFHHFSIHFPACSNHFPIISVQIFHQKMQIFPGFSQPAPAVSTVLPPRHCPKALAAWRSSRTPSCLASRCFSKAVARLLKRGSLVHGEMLSEGSENGE